MGDLDRPRQSSEMDDWVVDAQQKLGRMRGLQGKEKIEIWGSLAAKLPRIIIRESQKANKEVYPEDHRLELAATLAAGFAHSEAGMDEHDTDQLLALAREAYEKAKIPRSREG